eukprot:gene8045-9894_t
MILQDEFSKLSIIKNNNTDIDYFNKLPIILSRRIIKLLVEKNKSIKREVYDSTNRDRSIINSIKYNNTSYIIQLSLVCSHWAQSIIPLLKLHYHINTDKDLLFFNQYSKDGISRFKIFPPIQLKVKKSILFFGIDNIDKRQIELLSNINFKSVTLLSNIQSSGELDLKSVKKFRIESSVIPSHFIIEWINQMDRLEYLEIFLESDYEIESIIKSISCHPTVKRVYLKRSFSLSKILPFKLLHGNRNIEELKLDNFSFNLDDLTGYLKDSAQVKKFKIQDFYSFENPQILLQSLPSFVNLEKLSVLVPSLENGRQIFYNFLASIELQNLRTLKLSINPFYDSNSKEDLDSELQPISNDSLTNLYFYGPSKYFNFKCRFTRLESLSIMFHPTQVFIETLDDSIFHKEKLNRNTNDKIASEILDRVSRDSLKQLTIQSSIVDPNILLTDFKLEKLTLNSLDLNCIKSSIN